MKTKPKKEPAYSTWSALFKTVKNLRLPWIWIVVGLSINLYLSHLSLELPDTTAELLSGELTGAAITKAVLFYVVLGLTSFFMVAGQVQAQTYGTRKARETVWKKMLGMKMSYFDKNDPSDLMSTITNDTSSAVSDFINIIIYFIPSFYYVVGALLKINTYHSVLALSCFMLLPLKYIYALVMGRLFESNTATVYNRIGTLTGFLADRITHLTLIKTYTNEEKERLAGEEAARGLLKANMRIVHLDNIATTMLSVFDILQKFVVVIVAVILLQKREIDMAMWVAFFLFSQNLFTYMDQLFDAWVRIKSIKGSFRRVSEIMEGEDEENGATAEFPKNGDIRFENVTFAYADTDKTALDNVSFTVPRGTSAAIVGLCGSGKTTTVSLLERLYMPDSGTVTVGDVNINDVSLSEYRKNISYVQQGARVFSGTLREALTYGIEREVTDDEIFAASQTTGFSEYIGICDNCLNEEISADGTSMSGGQSQRLVLTRELLKGGDIILLDEPTSALDVRVSAKIQETINAAFADKTRILVTHDLEFAKKYDKILVMQDGKLVGGGTHETLLENCPLYKEMNEQQKEEATI